MINIGSKCFFFGSNAIFAAKAADRLKIVLFNVNSGITFLCFFNACVLTATQF